MVDEFTKFLKRKNIKIVEKVEESFNILVMNSITRKVKLLVALNENIRVVSGEWIAHSIKQDKVLDPNDYVLQAEKKFEKEHSFSFKESR